jgi:hypothetical protein
MLALKTKFMAVPAAAEAIVGLIVAPSVVAIVSVVTSTAKMIFRITLSGAVAGRSIVREPRGPLLFMM